VLDVATGTGAVAKELLARSCTVVGLDQSPDMLAEARRRLDGRLELVEASAESLPFPDASFDALTFTYLLRYVDEPGTTLRELARVVRPGGTVASLEFGLPGGLVRPAWELWTRLGLPLAGRAISPGWHAVGRFLNGSIRDFHERLPLPAQVELWRAAGLEDVHVRRMSLGGGVVMWARRA
jgi:demethylmenaquinone methyltransferase/2-methoxy-6-polyprenyl-1,4-benzoquinol methylase